MGWWSPTSISGVSQHVLRQFSVPTSSASHCDKVPRTAKSRDLICWPRGDVNQKVAVFWPAKIGALRISEMLYKPLRQQFLWDWTSDHLTPLPFIMWWYSPATRWMFSCCRPSPVVGLFLLENFLTMMWLTYYYSHSLCDWLWLTIVGWLLFKILYASFQFIIQRSPLDVSSQFQQTKISKQHCSAQVATAAPQSNSFTPSPAAKTGAASGVPPKSSKSIAILMGETF